MPAPLSTTTTLLLVLPVALLCFLLLCVLYGARTDGLRPMTSRLMASGAQSQAHRRDCDTELVYTWTDSQCRAVCKPPATYTSRNGACVNMLNTRPTNGCDPVAGVLAYLVGDPQLGRTRTRCLSVDPGIRPDDPRAPNLACTGGTVAVDYTRSFPQPADCRCPVGEAVALVANTRGMRAYGVCVDERTLPPFRHNDLTL